MDNFIKRRIEKMKNEIRESAMYIKDAGYKVELKTKKISDNNRILIYINDRYFNCSFSTGVYGNFFDVKNILETLSKFIREVA